MSRIKLDLKQFKHIKSDKNSTTLQHQDGHQLTIAHAPLGKESREQLSALSKVATDAQTPANKDEARHKGMMAEGGETKKVSPQPSPSPSPSAWDNIKSNLTTGKSKENKAWAEGGEIPPGPDADHPDAGNGDIFADVQKSMGLAKGGEICHACGGPIHKMAEGGPTDTYDFSQRPIVDTDIGSMPQPSPEEIQESKQKQARQVYAQQLARNYGQAEATMNGTDQVNPAIPPEKLPGPNGEPPQDIDANASMQAKVALEQKQADDAKHKAAAEQQNYIKTQQANEGAAMMGFPQKPLLGGPATDSRAAMAPEPSKPSLPFPQASPSDSMQGPEAGIAAGFNTQIQGLQGQAKAMGALGEQQAAVHQERIKSQQQAMETFQHSYQELEKERQAHMQDIRDGFVNPDNYWKGDPKTGAGGHSKIMAGIGMILAGFNPTSSPNAAVNFLQHQMDQNIDAQKANLGARQNLLSANLRQFGNLKDATDMTRIMQNDVVTHMLEANAAKAQGGPNGLAANAAKQAIGPIMRESAQLQFQMGLRHSMMKLSSGQAGDPSNTAAAEQMVNMLYQYNPEMAKQYAGRIVPGIGVSSSQVIPQEVRTQMLGRKNFDQMLNKYLAFAQSHSGSFNQKTEAEGKALAAELQGAYRQASNGGVFKEGEQKFIEKLIPEDPTQLFGSFRTNPKIKELIQSNHDQLNQLKAGYGMPVQQRAPAAPSGEGKIYENAKGERITLRNGKWVPAK